LFSCCCCFFFTFFITLFTFFSPILGICTGLNLSYCCFYFFLGLRLVQIFFSCCNLVCSCCFCLFIRLSRMLETKRPIKISTVRFLVNWLARYAAPPNTKTHSMDPSETYPKTLIAIRATAA